MVCSLLVMTMAYWAYTENYTTQASIQRVEELHRLVAEEKEAISILNAEWAYLNRPERLANLADLARGFELISSLFAAIAFLPIFSKVAMSFVFSGW